MEIAYQPTFERSETKYLLSAAQYETFLPIVSARLAPDMYPHSDIRNIYYDTPDFLLIRRSLSKPDFKEKLRLRTYCLPDDSTPAYVEIKRKYSKTVYKRRFCLPYTEALSFMSGQNVGGNEWKQIRREVSYALNFYGGIRPAMKLIYKRDSFATKDEPGGVRITFDSDIQWSARDTDLRREAAMNPLLCQGQKLMEIKCAGAMPMWLTRALCEIRAIPASFSKYGRAYSTLIEANGFRLPTLDGAGIG